MAQGLNLVGHQLLLEEFQTLFLQFQHAVYDYLNNFLTEVDLHRQCHNISIYLIKWCRQWCQKL